MVGKHTTYIFMVMTGGWCKWHCFNHINRIYMEPPSTFRKPAISTIQYDLRPSHHRPPWQRGSGSERCTLARVPSSTLGIQPSVRIQDIHNQKNIHNHIFIFRLIFIYIYIYIFPRCPQLLHLIGVLHSAKKWRSIELCRSDMF